MSQLRRSITAGIVLGAAAVAFAAHGAGTRAAVAPAGDTTAAQLLLGGQLAVLAPVFHNSQHTNVTTVTVGTLVHVKVTVAGAFGTPTGTVYGSLYANGACSGSPVKQSGPGILDGPTYDMTGFTYAPTSAGKLSVLVGYSGDDTYADTSSACTAITVTKATASVSMVVHDQGHAVITSIGYGNTVHPYVTINSRVGAPTGYFTVSWWKNDTCAGAPESSSINLGIGANGHAEVPQMARSASPVGSFAYKVHYQGDAGFKAGDSACAPYDVKKLTAVLSTSIHSASHQPMLFPATIGVPVHLWVGVSSGGDPAPTGTVTISSYLDGSCGYEDSNDGFAAAHDIELTSLAVSRSDPGTLSWKVKYSGDSVYAGKASACLKQTWKAPSQTFLDIHDDGHDAVTTIEVGAEYHFHAKVTGNFGVPTDMVGIARFDNGTCAGAGTQVGILTLGQGVADDTQHIRSFDTPGIYSFSIEYAGDYEYLGSYRCVKLTVTTAPTPAPTPTVKPTPKPTATPAPASTPKPTDAPDTDDPAVSFAPVATAEPTGSSAPATTSAPGASDAPAPAPSAAPGATDASGAGAGAGTNSGSAGSGSSGATSPSGDAGPGLGWIGLVVLIVLVVFGAGIALGRRRQQPAKA